MEKQKQIFPGGKTAAMRKKEQEKKAAAEKRVQERVAVARAAQKAAIIAAKWEHRQFLKNIGPATRLLMVRRGLRDFLVVTLMSICAGSGIWLVRNLVLPADKRVSYTKAFKRAYDVRNLTGRDRFYHETDCKPDGIYTLAAVLLLAVAAGVGIWRTNNDKKKAKEYAKAILTELGYTLPSPGLMTHFYWIEHPGMKYSECCYEVSESRLWKLHPVCKSIVKNIASVHPELFERLLSGDTESATRDYSIAVIRGYLKSHPDEFQRVLDAYDAETLPQSLVRKYAKQPKQR